MKKRRGILYCLLAASMLVSLTGCSKGAAEPICWWPIPTTKTTPSMWR